MPKKKKIAPEKKFKKREQEAQSAEKLLRPHFKYKRKDDTSCHWFW